MNRRVRTGPLEINSHGAYVGYMSYWTGGVLDFWCLWITAGPSAGMWKFDQ